MIQVFRHIENKPNLFSIHFQMVRRKNIDIFPITTNVGKEEERRRRGAEPKNGFREQTHQRIVIF